MKPFFIKGTDRTPEINFDNKSGSLSFKGRSYSHDTYDFYKPVNEWIDLYSKNLNDVTNFDIKVDYINSVSVKYLTNMIKKLLGANTKGKTIAVNWFYQADDEDDALELGMSLELEAGIKFNFIVIK
jgi:hypothetical protein